VRRRLCDRLFAFRDDQHRVAGGHDGICCRNEIMFALANHGHLHVAQHSRRQIAKLPAGKAFADRDLARVKRSAFAGNFGFTMRVMK